MVKASDVLPRLQLFAESFTGRPVRVITSSSRSQETAQTDSFLKVQVPQIIDIHNEEREIKAYKGLVALQASAATYNGTVPLRLLSLRSAEEMGELAFKKSKILHRSLEERLLSTSCLNTIELSRRAQCINHDYPILAEDMRNGLSGFFNPELAREAVTPEVNQTTNEIDLAIFFIYWENMGVPRKVLDDCVKKIPLDFILGKHRDEIVSKLRELSSFPNPFSSSYDDSLERTVLFQEFVEKLMKSHSIASPFTDFLGPEQLVELAKQEHRLLREVRKDRAYREEFERIFDSRRLAQLVSLNYVGANASSSALQSSFKEVPLTRAVSISVPAILEKEGGKTLYLPELRNGILVPRAVRISMYDLIRGQPLSDEQVTRQKDLEKRIDELKKEEKKRDDRIHSDVVDIYDIREEVKKRDAADREKKRREKQLDASKESRREVSGEVSIDRSLVKRIEREMEKIKPAARIVVRGCFEGEVDVKRYYDWWLETLAGESPTPNFYYQWLKKRRDVASVLLLDASHSTNRLVTDDKTILDLIKEASYYFSVAADTLEDKTAIIAYNGSGDASSRVFVLKDFNESNNRLLRRLRLLRGERNNRDGSAIRYAINHLSHHPAKTRFLFHVGDMRPSDKQYETSSQGQESCPYEGEEALRDVSHAFHSARAHGIIPYGICIDPARKPKKVGAKIFSNMNLAVLAKLKEREQETVISAELLRRNFLKNYRVISDVAKLPEALRSAYVSISFS